MTVYNLGSINVDRFYRVPHLPEPGETLPATGHHVGLGGKGANQSVAVARAGSNVRHIGRIGQDNLWVLERLESYGVDTRHISTSDGPTGQAVILVDEAGENSIITYAGANYDQSPDVIEAALAEARPGDVLMMQNEVSHKNEAARMAREKGLFIVYSAAPFRPEVVEEMLPLVDLLVLNEVEAGQLSGALGVAVDDLPVPGVLITRGSAGAAWHDHKTGAVAETTAFKVEPVDTTGAGDCFIGYTVAAIEQGLGPADALRLGAAAAAVKVTRMGTADAIPAREDVDAFLAGIDTDE